jgi:hypothetical protein
VVEMCGRFKACFGQAAWLLALESAAQGARTQFWRGRLRTLTRSRLGATKLVAVLLYTTYLGGARAGWGEMWQVGGH